MKKILTSLIFLGIFIYTANAQWTQVWTDDSTSTVVVGLFAKDSTIFIGTEGSAFHGIYRSQDNGLNWTTINYGLTFGGSANTFTSNDSLIFAATGDEVYRLKMNDTIWTPSSSGMPSGYGAGAIINKGGTLFAALDNASVYKSTDNGNFWENASNGLAVDTNFAGRLLIYGDTLFLSTMLGLYRTTDNGQLWTFISDSVDLREDCEGLCSLKNYIYATGYGNTLFRTNNNGLSWENVSNLGPIYDLISIGNYILKCTNNGIFKRSLYDTSWTQLNEGLPSSTSIASIAYNKTYLYIGTYGKGVWRRPLAETITAVKKNQNTIPTDYYLSQNYPNPFNPSTIIKYSLPTGSKVTIKIYNLLGQEIKTLVNTTETAGNHHVTFKAGNLSSGVYLYRIQAGNFVQTKKMVLLK